MGSLKTGISQCYWCATIGQAKSFEPARIELGHEEPTFTWWFDELLKGGFLLQDGKSLTVLLTGPPGSGKSTLALELCYRLAEISRRFSLYISTEAYTSQIIANAESFGWNQAKELILPFEAKQPENRAVAVWGADKVKTWNTVNQLVDAAIDALKIWFNQLPDEALKKLHRIIVKDEVTDKVEAVNPDVVVIDSLNILEAEARGQSFEKLLKMTSRTDNPPGLAIFVLDSEAFGKEPEFWEYVSDIVLRLDHSDRHDYYTRTIEILKARYQEHVWGKHQLKLYPRFEMPARDNPDFNRILQRAHPYRDEGGIFVFPSIHYYLSACKRKAPTKAPRLATTLPYKLNDVLVNPQTGEKGFPEGRCTAFIGTRGGHKSHLGYIHLLNRVLRHPEENAMIITLRDDEEMTKHTLEGILKQQFNDHDTSVTALEDANRLEILYYPPGYITPEEFLHRALMSIYRLKLASRKLTVLFNSLDQLSARFPLCAKQEIFIPGFIEILSAERITSIFIAVTEPGQPEEQYGLLSMADLILSFNMERFTFEDYFRNLDEVWDYQRRERDVVEKVERIKARSEKTFRDEIVLEVVRFAGGQRAGAKGILELVDEHRLDESLYVKAGLHFTPLSLKYR